DRGRGHRFDPAHRPDHTVPLRGRLLADGQLAADRAAAADLRCGGPAAGRGIDRPSAWGACPRANEAARRSHGGDPAVNAPLRRTGVVFMILFRLLYAKLNWVQAYKADEYRTSDYNGRVQIAEYDRKRGNIGAGGRALAESKATDGELKYLRTY